MGTAARQSLKLGPQFANIIIRDGEAHPKGEVSAWARFGNAKFTNEDAVDYSIVIASHESELQHSTVLLLPARGSAAFGSLVAASVRYAVYKTANPTEISAVGKGGGPVKFQLVVVEPVLEDAG